MELKEGEIIMKQLIVGLGEIGNGLKEVLQTAYHDVYSYDKKEAIDIDGHFDVLHICIPGGLKKFNQIVLDYAGKYQPGTVIIHSTVEVGTTSRLQRAADIHPAIGSCSFVHSPVRGKHPNMAEGIRNYVKYIGYCDFAGKLVTERLYEKANIEFKSFFKPETTELGKLFSTTDYGVNLAWAQIKQAKCKELGLSYDEVVTEFTKSYNVGIERAGFSRWKKPELIPPGKKIGGHCVVENAYILWETLSKDNQSLARFMELLIWIGKGDRKLEGFNGN